ncbi:MAG TPA: enoyl-CoA hydratase-related protein [Acidimicrobiales bacterium]|nr:enoyl-CoA hydratase-related protein [Acidimicrobiales bacterium]
MKTDVVELTVDAGLATITLNRPDAGNAIDLAVAQGLCAAATECTERRDVRAILLRGAGRNFCVGGDLKSFIPYGDDMGRHLKDVTTALHPAISRLARADAPVIAAVNGSAAGAGFSLVCSADLVVAAASARFLMAYTKIGLSPDGSGTWFLPRLVGARRAAELTLTNRMLDAAEALAWGIVTQVVADAELDAAATTLARAIADGPREAQAASKRLLRGSFDTTLETQMELETLALSECANSADGKEGIAAFLEKRPPHYGGE